jgi:hypothetical protein
MMDEHNGREMEESPAASENPSGCVAGSAQHRTSARYDDVSGDESCFDVSIFSTPIPSLGTADVDELLQDKAVENIRLEFKRTFPGKERH